MSMGGDLQLSLGRLHAERPDLASALGKQQIALLAHILFPKATRHRGCLISARGMAHPFRDDWFDGRYSLNQIEGILNHVHLTDEIDSEDEAMHASMEAALPVIAEIWRWQLKQETAIPHEVWTAIDPEYGPTLGFRTIREGRPMKHFVLYYDFVPDFREKRAPHRAVHLAHCNAAVARGELQLAGAFAEDPPGSMLIFKAENADLVEDFARKDPYVLQGVALGWRVREWVTVVGHEALTKVT